MAGLPKGWDEEAHAHWLANRRHDAINRILIPINEQSQKPPKPLLAQFAYYLFLLPDYRAAAGVLARASTLYPDDLEVQLNLATAQSRAKDHDAAVATAEAYIAKGGSDANLFDMLAHSQYRRGKPDEARQAGERSLAIKDEQAAAPEGSKLNPIPADTEEKPRIISFSLWGSNPRYLRGALHNVIAARRIYPDWTCRFYVDSSVDAGFAGALKGEGAEI